MPANKAALRRILLFFPIFLLTAAFFCLPHSPAALRSSALTEDGKIVVMLDPGHGGRDSGTGEGSREEAYYTLKVAQYCKAALEENGSFKVYMTREDNMGGSGSLSLMERGMAANAVNADLLLSCHFDGSTTTSLSGLSAYVSVIPRYAKSELAGMMLEKLNAATGLGIFKQGVHAIRDYGDTLYYWSDKLNWSLPSRPETGPLRDYYGVIKWCAYFGVPSIIVEHGFLSNPGNREIIEKEETLRALGEADAAAIIAYYTGHTHTFSAVERDFPSNCMLQGKNSARCTVCGCRQGTTLREGEERAHIWLEKEKKEPSCESDGFVEYLCEITRAMNVGKKDWCEDHTRKEILPALGHSYKVTSSSPASHGKDGYNTYTCTRCGKSYTETLPGEAHNFVFKETLEPTCEEAGANISRCTICGEERRESIPALGHSEGVPFLHEADCTKEGQKGYVCAVCGKEIALEILPFTEHQEELILETPPDCEHKGVRRFRCSFCDRIREEELPAIGHLIKEETKLESEGSCTEDATVRGVCEHCGQEVTQVLTPAPGHTEGEAYLENAACGLAGERGYICAVCGEKVPLEILAAPGHHFEEDQAGRTEPDCTKPGVLLSRCTLCGEEQRELLPALGHDFGGDGESGEAGSDLCIRCGISRADAALASAEGDSSAAGESAGDRNPAGGSAGAGAAGYLQAHPVVPAVIFGVIILLGGVFTVIFTYKKTHGVLRQMKEDEIASAAAYEAELAAKRSAEADAADAQTAETNEAEAGDPSSAGASAPIDAIPGDGSLPELQEIPDDVLLDALVEEALSREEPPKRQPAPAEPMETASTEDASVEDEKSPSPLGS